MHPDSNAVWAGIDVSQDWIDVAAVRQGIMIEQWRSTRSAAALRQVADRLKHHAVSGVIVEPTGGLERMVGAALAAAGIVTLRIDAKRVGDFARAHGVLAKTDAIDARVLALFGERMQPCPRVWLDEQRQQLADWVARQQQLTALRTAERNRLRRAPSPQVSRSIPRTLGFLERELERVERAIEAGWSEREPARRESEARLRSMPGVGVKTARVLLAHLPEPGRASRREIASIAGLAPFAWAVVRSAFYLASWTAVRAGKFRGEPHQLALTAVASRMLVVLNERMRTGRDYDSAHA